MYFPPISQFVFFYKSKPKCLECAVVLPISAGEFVYIVNQWEGYVMYNFYDAVGAVKILIPSRRG